MKLLHLDSSITGDGSVSRQLSAAIVAKLRAADPAIEASYRDLVADPLENRRDAAAAQSVNRQRLVGRSHIHVLG